MKYFLITLLSAFSLHSFGQVVINDRNVQLRNVAAFNGIKISGPITAYVTIGNESAVAVSASDEKFRDNIRTEVVDGVLNISFNNNGLKFNGDKELRAYISYKDLSSVDASGASEIIFNDIFKQNNCKIRLSGASEIKGAISMQNLSLDLSGASTVKINGDVENLKIEASGASDVKNYDLVANNCMVELSGASDVKITVKNSIKAKASGASNLYYKGNPESRDMATSGASNIAERN
jgi:hypothetical protein